MGRHEQIIPTTPPAARAPAVLEQRAAIERELADLKLQTAETALAAYENKSGGREKLAALDAKIRACVFQIDCNAAAHELAVKIDREAVSAWRTDVQANPKQAIEGITKSDCCRRCSADHGCTITGDACAHPIKVGRIGPRLQGNPTVKAVYKAAREKLGMPA
jgi:hypothetical protein